MRKREYTSTPLNEINQEDEDFDGLAAHPQRDPIQIAPILGKMDMPFHTYSGHLAQIGIQHSAEAPRDGMRILLQTLFVLAAVQVSFHLRRGICLFAHNLHELSQSAQ